MQTKRNLSLAIALLAVLVVSAAGCGGTGAGGGNGEGSIAENFDLSGAELAVASKEFTEQLVLGQITVQSLEAAGASVDDQTGLAGSVVACKALLSGEIDLYWEYSGTGWLIYLEHTDPINDQREQYEAVAKEDLKKNDIRWLEPAPANSTYAIAVRSGAFKDIRTLSDYARLGEERPDAATMCVGTEFATRDDGLPGLEKYYGFELPNKYIAKMDEGAIYPATDKGDPCNFGEVFNLDGRIKTLDLRLLKDDKQFFPYYSPSIIMRQETLKKYPQIEKLFAPIVEKLDSETIRSLNAGVDVDGKTPEIVVEEWLQENGFTG
ncbi:glycine betaine ABC transporter substrate-binding protein [soil metagenome]